jgi:hypothetical protein
MQYASTPSMGLRCMMSASDQAASYRESRGTRARRRAQASICCIILVAVPATNECILRHTERPHGCKFVDVSRTGSPSIESLMLPCDRPAGALLPTGSQLTLRELWAVVLAPGVLPWMLTLCWWCPHVFIAHSMAQHCSHCSSTVVLTACGLPDAAACFIQPWQPVIASSEVVLCPGPRLA